MFLESIFLEVFFGIMSDSGSSDSEPEVTDTVNSTRVDPPSINILAVPELLRKKSIIILANPTAKEKTTVWQKFGLAKHVESETLLPFAICRDCKKPYLYKSGRSTGTSTFKRHLNEVCVAAAAKDGQQRMTQFMQPKEKKPISTAAKAAITNACVVLAAKDLRAFQRGFRQGLRVSHQKQQWRSGEITIFSLDYSSELIPGPTTVSRGIANKAEDLRALLRLELLKGSIDYRLFIQSIE